MIKVEKLRVNNFRGIRSFEFKMNQKSFVVAGRNGTGKSGVIDALEFALTGSITRLTGSGTAGVSVKSHAPHVDIAETPKEAWVEMTFTVVGTGSSHTLRRSVATPRKPALSPETPEAVEALKWMLKHPEFALTRREIVRFVLAEGKSRADGVADLLGLERIGQVRGLLVRVRNADKRDHASAETLLASRERALVHASGIETLNPETLSRAINADRTKLGLAPIAELTPEAIIEGVDSSSNSYTPSANRNEWLQRISALHSTVENALSTNLDGLLGQLIEDAADKSNSGEFMTALESDALLDSALELFNGTDCPVCATTWLPGEFEEVIARKKAQSAAAREEIAALKLRASRLLADFTDLQQTIEIALPVAEGVGQETINTKKQLEVIRAITKTLRCISNPSELKELATLTKSKIAPIKAWTCELEKKVRELPLPNEADEQKGRLRSLSHNFHEYAEQERLTSSLLKKSLRSTTACEVFEYSTAASLIEIYSAVQSKFALFYSAINADDESQFSATLTQSGAGLDMNVDFYGRGEFPPGAYHSEGHQDAMGLCLYLALAQFTLGTGFTLCALDDVLMSVDSGHRRFVVTLLMKQFPDTQFVVTTHDEQWMRQMKSLGFAQGRNVLQFRTWNVDSGPVDWAHYEPWGEIQTFLEAGHVKAAAGSLRSYLEHIGRECASNLAAPIPYKLDGQNTLGEIFNSSIKTLRATIKKGKKSANSWAQPDLVAQLDTWDTRVAAAAMEAKQAEWAINTIVHFNEWENQTPAEFALVASSWRALMREFACSKCEGLLKITSDKDSLRCACQNVSVNLLDRN